MKVYSLGESSSRADKSREVSSSQRDLSSHSQARAIKSLTSRSEFRFERAFILFNGFQWEPGGFANVCPGSLQWYKTSLSPPPNTKKTFLHSQDFRIYKHRPRNDPVCRLLSGLFISTLLLLLSPQLIDNEAQGRREYKPRVDTRVFKKNIPTLWAVYLHACTLWILYVMRKCRWAGCQLE